MILDAAGIKYVNSKLQDAMDRRRHGVATLLIDHPSKMNAMTFEMWSSLRRAWFALNRVTL
jgi:enoyl-CoA hydratase/carnithine racemase